MIKQAFINRFDGGMQNDVRSEVLGGSRTVKHFDMFSYPKRLVPFFDSESGNDDGTRKFANFLYANSKLWGLGVVSGTAKPEIWSKTDFSNSTWTTPANNAGTLSRSTALFVYYKGFIYGAQGGSDIWKFDVTGAGWTDAEVAITYTSVAQGLVHSKDDTLYIPYDNKIASYSPTTSWVTTALILPSDCYITSICEYGNFLAIGTAPLGSAGKRTSRVYLWDRNTSLTTLSESIDWGEGPLLILEEVNGDLLGVTASTSNNLYPRLQFKRYTGAQEAEFVSELIGDLNSALNLTQFKQRANNRLYFAANMVLDGNTHYGIWTFGKNAQGKYVVSVDRLYNNDTSPNSISGFYLIGDYMFAAYVDGSGNEQVSKTNDVLSFTATSIYESLINEDMKEEDKMLNKQLISIGVSYDALPTNGQVVLKYKVDGSSYITVGTETTDGQVVSEYTYIATGDKFTAGREYQFRLESTGGAQITGVKYKYEILESLI